MVSHDLQEVFHLASSVIMLKNGTVINEGKPADVFSQSSQCKLKTEYYSNIYQSQKTEAMIGK
jgi:ABC-type sulfate/molybdate transport systems ATPase subunit